MSPPARYWRSEEGRLVCTLCPRECVLAEGRRGFCFTRKNEGGRLITSGYGRVIGLGADPVEKKPLNHFLPGTGIMSFGTAGCNLGCKFCQNWDMSKARSLERSLAYLPPERIPQIARSHGCDSVAFTYNDPTIFIEYAIDVATACHEAGIKTAVVTAGYIQSDARQDMYAHMDAANIDLKAFTETFYQQLCGAHLEPILETLKYVKHETATWLEVTTLLIPGANDSASEIKRLSEWLRENLGADTPIHFTAFHPDYKLSDRTATTPATLTRAREIALAAGLNYVYVGNVHDRGGSSTYCPGCGKLLIERNWYQLGDYHLKGDSCAFCGWKIAGVFSTQGLGAFGSRRLRVLDSLL